MKAPKFRQKVKRSQSAMEYLMTYGWAILIIAIVLSVLFQLGVFNGNTFGVKAQPGACQVTRVASGQTLQTSLTGECQGFQPEYTLQLPGGTGVYVNVPYESDLNAVGSNIAFSFSYWFKSNSFSAGQSLIAKNGQYCSSLTTNPQLKDGDLNNHGSTYAGSMSTGTWYFETVTISAGATNTIIMYLNANPVASYSGVWAPSTDANALYIGGVNSGVTTSCGAVVGTLNGQISNVQIYNKTLTSGEVNSLYFEGIGGAPIDPTAIVGWWPLNGNLNDYSGNNDNGQLIGSGSYSSFWQSGYTQP